MKRDLIWLSVFATAAFAVLIGLGIWQLQRLEWKRDLISRIEARANAEPVSLAQVNERRQLGRDVDFLRVRLKGRYLNDRERHLYTVLNGKAGWRIITPLETPSGRIVMVDRGFVPEALKDPESRPESLIEGRALVTGAVRMPERQGLFTPDNDPEKNVWHWRDLEAMARSVLSDERMARLEPFFVQHEEVPVMKGWPKEGVTGRNLPNNHLQYALTWFALAGGLVAVFALYLRSRLRRPRS